MFGLVGVAEGGERFVVVARGDAGDHGGFAVAAETVFQEPGEDAVSVGNYVAGGALSAGVYAPVFGICEGGDDATEGGERFVDIGAFSKTLTSRFCCLCSLTSCKIDKPYTGNTLGRTVGFEIVVYLFEHYCEDSMTARGGIVHFGGSSGTRGVSEAHVSKDLSIGFDRHVG